MTPLTVTVAKAMEISGLSKRTIHDRIASGELSSVKVGSRRLIHYVSLARMLACADVHDGAPGIPESSGMENGMVPEAVD